MGDVTQPSEAVLIKEFFRSMWLRGITIVVTARQPIHRLYMDGHNREDFVELFPELRERCSEVECMSMADYRYEGLESAGTSIVGQGQEAADSKFSELAGEITPDFQL